MNADSIGVHPRSSAVTKMSLEAIKAAIPHREPFLLIDEIVEQTENHIVCRKTFHGRRVLVCRPLSGVPADAGRVALRSRDASRGGVAVEVVADNPDTVPVVSRMNNVKFKTMVRPGDTVTLEVDTDRAAGRRVFYGSEGNRGRKTAVTFEFACKMAPKSRNASRTCGIPRTQQEATKTRSRTFVTWS